MLFFSSSREYNIALQKSKSLSLNKVYRDEKILRKELWLRKDDASLLSFFLQRYRRSTICTITQALAWCVYVIIICAQGPWIRWIIMIGFHRWESKSCKFDIFPLQEDSIRFDCSENRDWFWLKWNNRLFVNDRYANKNFKISFPINRFVFNFRFRIRFLFSKNFNTNYKNISLENNFFFLLSPWISTALEKNYRAKLIRE